MEELLAYLRKFRDERDWRQFHNPKDLAVSISIEAAELLELFQWSNNASIRNNKHLEDVRSEVADIFLYLLYFCDATGIDLIAAAKEKAFQNERRYTVENSSGIAGPAGRIRLKRH